MEKNSENEKKIPIFCYAEHEPQKQCKQDLEIAILKLNEEKQQLSLYGEIYKKFKTLTQKQELNFPSFSDQLLFLKDTTTFVSQFTELNYHFGEDLVVKREHVINYFKECSNNPTSDLCKSIFQNLMENISFYEQTDVETTNIPKQLMKISKSYDKNNLNKSDEERLLNTFYSDQEIRTFIENHLRSEGVKSPIFRHLLSHKMNVTLIICVENIDKKFDIVEIHKYGGSIKKSHGDNRILETTNADEIFILYKNRQFSLLKFDKYCYEGFQSRHLINHNFGTIAKTLHKLYKNDNHNSLNSEEFTSFWKDLSKKYNLIQNSFALIFNPKNEGDEEVINSIYNSVLRKLLRIEYQFEKNVLTISEFKPNESARPEKNYNLKDESVTEKMIKEFITYIVTIRGTPIVEAIAIRLFDERNTQNLDEFLITLKTIFLLLSENETLVKTLTFMILGSDQCHWIPQLILIKLEKFVGNVDNNIFKSWEKILERNDLKKIVSIMLEKILNFNDEINENPITFFNDIIENIKYFDDSLIKDLKALNLLSWKMITTDKYWDEKLSSLKDNEFNNKKIYNIKKYLEETSSKYGLNAKELSTIFVDKMKNENYSNDDIVKLFENLSGSKWVFSDYVLDIMKKNPINKWVQKIGEHLGTENGEMNETKIANIIKSNGETSESIKYEIDSVKDLIDEIRNAKCPIRSITSKDENDESNGTLESILDNPKEISEVIKQNIDEKSEKTKQMSTDNKELITKISELTEVEIKFWLENFNNNFSEDVSIVEPMAIIMRVFKLKTGKDLRSTQLMAILTMWKSNKGILMQVSTGEGKTFIGVAFALLKFLYKQKVDIITSSTVLAMRDAKDENKIFEFFGAIVKHNCFDFDDENIEKIRDAYQNSDIIYGTLGTFQRDYLQTEFYEKNIMVKNSSTEQQFGKKQRNVYHHFKNILIDEVDSMLLDKGNNILYFSENIPNMDEIEGILVFLRLWINKNFGNTKGAAEGLDVKMIKKSILDYIYGVVDEQDIKNMDPEVDAEQVIGEMRYLGIIDEHGLIIKENFTESQVTNVLIDYPVDLQEKVISFCRVKIHASKLIKIPKYMKDFVLQHLEKWIKSAVRSMFMKNGVDFVVEKPRSKDKNENGHIIKIIDLDTGTDMTDSHWDDALHQMLQIKYNCELTQIGLKCVFVSNVSFLKKYDCLYGMTGTLGNAQERMKINKIYDIDYVTIPRFFARKFIEHQPISFKDAGEWIDKIKSEVKMMIGETNKRSVLLICQSISDTQNFQIKIKEIDGIEDQNIRVYNRDYEEFKMDDFQPGHVIISTNLAGRGTDIKISDELNKNGGLHVILTFLPDNSRVEEQALGRAARSNNYGSGRIIFHSNETAIRLKQIRNQQELKRLDELAAYYENFIKIEEKFFLKFHNKYRELNASGKSPIFLKNFLIQWALWLDKNSALLDDWKNCIKKQEIEDSFMIFVNQENEMHPIIKLELFKSLDIQNKFSEATEIMKETNPELFSHQYFEFYRMVKADQEVAGCKVRCLTNEEIKQLRKCYKMLTSIKNSRQINTEIIQNFRENAFEEKDAQPIESIKHQRKEIMEILNLYEGNIMMLLGSDVTHQTFDQIIENEVLKKLVYQSLLRKNYLILPRISKNIEDEDIKQVAFNQKIDSKKLKIFLQEYSEQSFQSVNDFGELIKLKFKFPSRHEFWETLKEKGVLEYEESYAIINTSKIEKIDPSAGEIISTLTSEKLSVPSKNKIYFVPTKTHDDKPDNIMYKMKELETFTSKRIDFLVEHDVIQFNMSAIFNIEKYKTIKNQKIFDNYDDIEADDFNSICSNNYKIIKALLECEILTPRDGASFALNCFNFKKFLDPKKNKNPDPLFGFKAEIYELLMSKFAYRIALDSLAADLAENSENIFINLKVNPHLTMLGDLLINLIIETSKANHEKLLVWDKLVPHIDIKKVLKDADIHESDENSQKTYNFLVNCLNEINGKGKDIEAALDRCICPLYTNTKFKNPEIYIEDIHIHLPQNRHLDVMEQKGLEKIINFRQKQDKTNDGKWSWMTFLKIVLFVVAVVCMAIAIYSLNLLNCIGFIRRGINKLASYALSAIGGFKAVFNWIDYKLYVPLASIVRNIASLLFHIGSTVLSNFYGVTESTGVKEDADAEIQDFNSEFGVTDKYVKFIDYSKYYAMKSKDQAARFIEKFANEFQNATGDLASKVKNSFKTKSDDILTTIDEVLESTKPENVEKTIKHFMNDVSTTLVSKFCESLATAYKEKLNEAEECSSDETTLPNFAVDDSEIDNFVGNFYDSLSTSLKNKHIQRKDKNSDVRDHLADVSPTEQDIEEADEMTEELKLEENIVTNKSLQKKIDKKLKKEAAKRALKEDNRNKIVENILTNVWHVYKKLESSKIVQPSLVHVNNIAENSSESGFKQKIKTLMPSLKKQTFDKNLEEYLEFIESKDMTVEQIRNQEFVPLAASILNATCNKDVYAKIIDLNVPMDMYGFKILKIFLETKFNISFTFVVNYNGSLFTIGDVKNKESKVINLEYTEGHFRCKMHKTNIVCENNCIYYAISDQFERIFELSIGDFREGMSELVKNINDSELNVQKKVTKYKHEFEDIYELKDDEDEEDDKTELRFVEMFKVRDYFLINSTLTIKNIVIIEKDFILPNWMFQRNSSIMLNGAQFFNPLIRLLNKISHEHTKGRTFPSISIPAIVYQNLASYEQSKMAHEFCEKQQSFLLNGEIDHAIEMKFKDQHNTTVQVRNELHDIIFLQDLEDELNNLHTAQKDVVINLHKSKYINDFFKKYLLNVIENLPKNTYDEEFKREWKRNMNCSEKLLKLLTKCEQIKKPCLVYEKRIQKSMKNEGQKKLK